MAGEIYSVHRKVFPKFWQRHLFGICLASFGLSVGYYFQQLSMNRYTSFRGRSAIYGPDTVNEGKFFNKE